MTKAVNNHHSNIDIEAYALGFLAGMNNFINAQKTIHSQIGLGSQSVLNASGILNGVLSAADLLILVSGNAQIFPSRAVRHGKPPSMVSNLAKATFNSNAVVCNPNAGKDFVPGPDIQIAFRLYEAAWFNQNQSLEFYLKIFNDIVVINSNGALSMPRPQAIFSQSPQLLLERVKEDCQSRLHRPRIYFDKPIDLDSVGQLYRNGHNWLKANNLITNHSAASAPSQQLALLESGKHPNPPTEPMLFCQAIQNDAGQEEYITHLYLPRAMLEEVWAMGDGPGFIGTSLAVFSDNLTPEQNLALPGVINRPAFHKTLQDFYTNNPRATQTMRNKALMLQLQRQAEDLKQLATARDVPSSTIVGGKITAEQVFIAVNNRLEINADIVAKNPFLASLLDDVEIRSLVARVYGCNHENFQDVIQNQVRIYAKEKLQIFSPQDVIFRGIQTTSEQGTEVYAGRDVLDFSVNLVMQRVQRFSEGYSLDAHIKPSVSHHTTSATSSIDMHGVRNVYMQAIVLEALHASFTAEQGQAIIDDAIELSIHQEEISYETGGFFSEEITKVEQKSISASVPAQFNVKETLKISSKTGTKLTNINSSAKLNVLRSSEGQVFFLLGVNHVSSVEQYSRQSMVWVKARTTTKEQHYFSDSKIRGLIEVAAKGIVVEQVRAQTQDFVARIKFDGDISYKTVDAYCNIKTRKVQGPGPGLVMLINAVVTALTFNPSGSLASSVLGGATSGAAHAALTSGFVTLSTRAALALVKNQGNPFAAAKELASKDVVKDIGMSMLTAGLLTEVCGALNLPVELKDRKLFEQHLKYNIAKAAVNVSLNVSINGQSMEQAIFGGIIDAAISTVTSAMLSDGALSDAQYTALQAGIGALKGVMGPEGALCGALSAYLATVLPKLAEPLKPNSPSLQRTADAINNPLKPSLAGDTTKKAGTANFLATPGYRHHKVNVPSMPTSSFRTASVDAPAAGYTAGDIYDKDFNLDSGGSPFNFAGENIFEPKSVLFSPSKKASSTEPKMFAGSSVDEVLAKVTSKSDLEAHHTTNKSTADTSDYFGINSDGDKPTVGSHAWNMNSVDKFMSNPLNTVVPESKDGPRIVDGLKYGAGRLVGGVRAMARPVELFARDNDSGGGFIYTGESPEYEYIPERMGRTFDDGHSNESKSFLSAYKEHHKASMDEARMYARKGNPFMAGYTSGVADMDVGMDVAAVASLGYGAVRAAPRLFNLAKTGTSSMMRGFELATEFKEIEVVTAASSEAAYAQGNVVNKAVITGKKIKIDGVEAIEIAPGSFTGSDKLLFKNAQNIRPIDGFFDIVIHGSPEGFFVQRAGKELFINHRSLSTYIKTIPEYKPGMNVRLVSCNTGKTATSVAQDLANKLGANVLAPNDFAHIFPSGRITIGPRDNSYINSGQWIKFKVGRPSPKL